MFKTKTDKETIKLIIEMREAGWGYKAISDTSGISERTARTYGKQANLQFSTTPYHSLQKKQTEGGSIYFEGKTNIGDYAVEIAEDGSLYYAESAVWEEGRKHSNCKRTLRPKNKVLDKIEHHCTSEEDCICFVDIYY